MAESSERNTRNTAARNEQRERYGDNSRTLPAKLVVIAIVGMLVIAGAYIFVQMNRVSAPDVSATQAEVKHLVTPRTAAVGAYTTV